MLNVHVKGWDRILYLVDTVGIPFLLRVPYTPGTEPQGTDDTLISPQYFG